MCALLTLIAATLGLTQTIVYATPIFSSTTGPIVSLDYATFQGFTNANGITNFLGMRYAAAPTGNNRFRAPQDPPVVAGVQRATQVSAQYSVWSYDTDVSKFGNVCIGVGQTAGFNLLGGYTYGEDCLMISVSSPSAANSSSLLPVLVYITGGGFAIESSTNFVFDEFVNVSGGTAVVVQFNYRVGALGFLAGQEVENDGNLNAGMLDQRKALQWVRKYISLFGGDPDHVIIFGASAGAGSVGLHLTAYGGRNDRLFVGAAGDAFFYPTTNNKTYTQAQFDHFASITGCGSAANRLACIRTLEISALQKGNVAGTYPGQSMSSQYTWTPVVDGDFIQDYPLRLYQDGKFVKVPLIVGDVLDEGTIFANNAASPSEVSSFVSANYPALSQGNLTVINTLYPPSTSFPLRTAYFASSAAAYGEATFKCPSYLIGASMANAGLSSHVWTYNFTQSITVLSAAGFGVAHNSDLGAFFGPLVGPSSGLFDVIDNLSNAVTFGAFATSNKPSSVIAMRYLISFVRTLDPNTYKATSAPMWNAAFTSGAPQTLQLQNDGSGMHFYPSDFLTRCQFWQDLIPSTGQ
ncbi:alpha/beta-hydrolase [Aureobasidium pullulans]|nr:alpha/beta-hydrolase [Aureobasidium pullulans]THZ53220.1 alpha/beta-hydrolase [Aureobasidium pullulans]THZ57928.1 alpha/beta-hydrolase [Aureobasidium pullulans]